jgi:hypothetical protein
MTIYVKRFLMDKLIKFDCVLKVITKKTRFYFKLFLHYNKVNNPKLDNNEKSVNLSNFRIEGGQFLIRHVRNNDHSTSILHKKMSRATH